MRCFQKLQKLTEASTEIFLNLSKHSECFKCFWQRLKATITFEELQEGSISQKPTGTMVGAGMIYPSIPSLKPSLFEAAFLHIGTIQDLSGVQELPEVCRSFQTLPEAP